MDKEEQIVYAIKLYNRSDQQPTKDTFINLYENELECAGEEGIEDAIIYFGGNKASKILNCDIKDLAEFCGESEGGTSLLYSIIEDGKFIEKLESELNSSNIFLYLYKKVKFILEDIDGIVSGLLIEKDIPKVLLKNN